MGQATSEQVTELCQQVKTLKELAEKKSAEHEDSVKRILTDVLKDHPGFAGGGERKMVFPEGSHGVRALEESLPKELQQKQDDILILSMALKKHPTQLKAWNGFKREMGDFKKALDTATSGGASEWVPTDFSSTLYELVRLETKVWSLFDQIVMPTNPYKLPIQVGRINTFKHPEQTADTSQTAIPYSDGNDISGNITLTAVGHAAYVLISKDLEEDAIVPMLPFLRSELVKALAEGREDCVLNGDTTATHEDSDTTSATSRRKMWKGLRRLSHDSSLTADLGNLSLTTIRGGRALMGKYGLKPSDLVWIVSMTGFMQLVNLPELTTVDKYGTSATILNGELAKLDGSPVIVSEWIREDLNSSGVYQSGQTRTVAHLINRKGFVTGVRREANIQLLVEKYAEFDQDALKVRERVTFSPIYSLSANKTLLTGQNIGTTFSE
ncbi:MAG: phage major capsid protein [Acidobacteria bacterium]|nr:MAG: phage major capsid protein [Acidobacteriota bacterium]